MRFFNLFTPAHTEIVNKKLADVRLSGRSMVEMLGVLAIIGVLSVGAISGYSKAMFKYKLNRHAEAFNQFLNNAISLRADLARSVSPTASFNAAIFAKLNLIPDGLKLKGNYIYDMFNNRYALYYGYNSAVDGYYYSLSSEPSTAGNKITEQSVQICRNFINVVKENSSNIDRVEMWQYENESNRSVTSLYGDTKCTNGRQCLKSLKLADIDKFCRACESEYGCRFAIDIIYNAKAPY